MQINRLTLTQFRAIEQADFVFQPGMNLIVGINGVGKSAVLDALRILLSQSLPRFTASRSRPLPINTRNITIGHEFLMLETQFNVGEVAFSQHIYHPRQKRIEDQSRQGEVREAVYEVNARNELTPNDDALLKRIRASRQQPLMIYYSTRRSIFEDSGKATSERTAGGQAVAYADALAIRSFRIPEFAHWWLAREVLSAEGAIDRQILSTLESAVIMFLEEFSALRVVRNDDGVTALKLTKGHTELDVELLSDGERGILALVLDLTRRLVQANPGIDDPLAKGKAVVLIDELDLHLHPRWQRTIIEKLTRTFTQCQFIVTTHSPFIIQSLNSGQLINLGTFDDELPSPDVVNKEEYANKSVEDITETVMGVEMPQKSERYLDMMRAAEEYFRLLRTEPEDLESQEALKHRLDELSEPYSDDPAYMALLKIERETRLGKD